MPYKKMIIVHKNNLNSYLSDWSNQIKIFQDKRSFKPGVRTTSPQVFRALHTHKCDTNTILRLLDDRLTRLKKNWKDEVEPLTPESFQRFDHAAYEESGVFLKSFFIFFRIYLDDIAGVIRHFYPKLNLSPSFNKLIKINLQDEDKLAQILISARGWFPEFRNRRDELIHHYETFVLFLDDKSSFGSSKRMESGKAIIYGHIHEYLGGILCNCQQFIDELLGHFDDKFQEWYGIVQTSNSRTITHHVNDYMLWWAHEHGGYRHDDMSIHKDGT